MNGELIADLGAEGAVLRKAHAEPKARFIEAWIAYREIQKLVPQVMKKYEVKIPHTDLDGDIVPVEIKALPPKDARVPGTSASGGDCNEKVVAWGIQLQIAGWQNELKFC